LEPTEHLQPDAWADLEKETRVQVFVRDNNVDQALKALKRKMQREGVFRDMKLRKHYEKPSERKVRERAEAIRRARKLARKKLQREGLLPPAKPRVERTAGGRAGPAAQRNLAVDCSVGGNQEEVGAAERARYGR
jgi:small subunit ribosomal protein S21